MVEKEIYGLKKRTELLIVISLIVLGAVLRFLFLGREGLWYDETLTALSLRMPFFDMVRDRLAGGHSPLYFTILYPYAKLFGTGEVAMRLPSVLASILSLYIFLLIAKRLFSDFRICICSLCFFVLSAMNIYFGQEARMYSFCVLFVLLSFYFLIRAMDEDRPRLWIFYLLATAVAVNLNASIVPVVFAQLVYVLIKRERILQFILSLLAVVILYIPMGIFYLRMQELEFIEWLSPVTLRTVLEIFYGFGFRPLPSMTEIWIPSYVIAVLEYLSIYLLGAVILWGVVSAFLRSSISDEDHQTERQNALLLLLWLFVPLILEYGYSVLRQPMIGPKRYIISLSPAYYLLLGLGLEQIRWKRLRNWLAVAMVIFFSFALLSFYASPKRENWRDAIAFVDEHLGPGEVMFGNISTQTLYNYYGKESDMIILDIRYLNTRGFAKGWILLRDMDYRTFSSEIEGLSQARSLLHIDDYEGLKLYYFER